MSKTRVNHFINTSVGTALNQSDCRISSANQFFSFGMIIKMTDFIVQAKGLQLSPEY